MATLQVNSLSNSSESKPRVPLKIEPLLSSYTAGSLARTHIVHHQLRHLVACPLRRGVVYFVDYFAIQKVNLLASSDSSETVASLSFLPTCIAAIAVPDIPNATLLAAGSISSELYLGLHVCPTSENDSSETLWEFETRGNDFVNSVVFVPPGLLKSAKSTIKLLECRNDGTISIYSIVPYTNVEFDSPNLRLKQCGSVQLETLPNYVSLSPDGKVLLCVGDTDKAYLYSLTVDDEDEVTFVHIITYSLPNPSPAFFDAVTIPLASHFRSRACFAASWSSDGNRFAIASQEGQLTVWDFRTSEVIFNYWIHAPFMASAFGGGVTDGIRSVRFCKPPKGREVLLWTEHNDNLHAIDADAFDLATHCIIPFPDLEYLYGLPNGVQYWEEPLSSLTDIAGMCLDPTEEWLYVASVEGMVEFHVNG